MKNDRRGSVLIIFAITLSTLILFSGVAIDLARVYIVRSRLQTSTDAAALLGAREEENTQMQSDATAIFMTNFNSNAPVGGANLMDATVSNISVQLDQKSGVVTVAATASVPTTFLKMLPGLPTSIPVTTTSTSQATSSNLELALVLDTTASMTFTDPSTGGTKLQALQKAVADLMDVLYGDKDTVPNLWVSVVPFITTINVGNGAMQTAWLKQQRSASDYRHNGGTQYSWSGCVEARIDGGSNDDETETSPIDHPFMPFYADDTYGLYTYKKNSSSSCSSSKTAYSNDICMGDNDWGAPASVNIKQNPAFASGLQFGPNRGCPASILPLTASKSSVLNKVNSLPTYYSGTIIGLGLQGGWFTLSPQWRGSSGWGDMMLPHDYYTSSSSSVSLPVSKIAVLVSDGENVWGYSPGVVPGSLGQTLYMPYGRLSSENNPLNIPLGRSVRTNASNANDELDNRALAVCSNMKAKDIKIYVVGLGVSSQSARNLLQSCSSGTDYYYIESPTAADLDAAFLKVAHQISQLRLVR